jgi:hypothetical protein
VGTTGVNGQIIGSFSSTTAEGKTVTATISGTLITDNAAVTVNPGPAANLAFSQQPMDAAAGATIAPPVVVDVTDTFGNPVNATVHLVLDQAVLGGTALLTGGGEPAGVPSPGGAATYSNLSVDTADPVNPYKLTASAAGAAPVTSAPFLVNP